VSLGLLKVRPGADPDRVAAQVRRLFAGQGRADVEVLTRDELRRKEILFWTTEKSLGLIFWFGVGVALLVGVVVVCQVLSSDILEHSKEYATLKAMGYSNRYLGWIVLQQGLLLALFGYLPALLVALGLYDLTRRGANLPILMTPARAGGVLALALLMCGSAALVSVRKITSSDPANLF
jgi:putative ABC transport system permease protein